MELLGDGSIGGGVHGSGVTAATAVGGGKGSKTALAEAAAMAEEATVAADRRRGPQHEAETPQHSSLRDSYAAGPDTRNRT